MVTVERSPVSGVLLIFTETSSARRTTPRARQATTRRHADRRRPGEVRPDRTGFDVHKRRSVPSRRAPAAVPSGDQATGSAGWKCRGGFQVGMVALHRPRPIDPGPVPPRVRISPVPASRMSIVLRYRGRSPRPGPPVQGTRRHQRPSACRGDRRRSQSGQWARGRPAGHDSHQAVGERSMGRSSARPRARSSAPSAGEEPRCRDQPERRRGLQRTRKAEEAEYRSLLRRRGDGVLR